MLDAGPALGRTLLDAERVRSLVELSAMIDAARVPGCVVEVGVYRGGSTWLLASANPQRQVLAFDTFEGIPYDPWEMDGHRRGDFAADFEDVREFLAGLPNVQLHRGIFPASLPGPLPAVALAHVDVDMELSARECIIALWPKISPGGFLVFDDYNAEACPGLKRAVDEFFGGQVRVGPHPQAWVRKEKP